MRLHMYLHFIRPWECIMHVRAYIFGFGAAVRVDHQ